MHIDLIFLRAFKKIFEVCTGSELFYGVGAGGLLGRMVRLVGEVPPLWASYWASNESLKDQGTPVFIYLFALKLIQTFLFPEISPARASAEWMRYRTIFVRCFNSEEEADRVVDLLRSMLVLDPARRPSIRQVMETHCWLTTTVPNNVA